MRIGASMVPSGVIPLWLVVHDRHSHSDEMTATKTSGAGERATARVLYPESMRTIAWVSLLLACVAACSRPAGDLTDGKALFNQTCARCHGPDGRGDPVAKAQLGVPDMRDAVWQKAHPDELIKRTVHEGSKSKKMPPFGDLYTDAQLDVIIAYVRSLETEIK